MNNNIRAKKRPKKIQKKAEQHLHTKKERGMAHTTGKKRRGRRRRKGHDATI